MWDTVVESSTPLSHDPPCARCGHSGHHYLPCDDCSCAGDAGSAYDAHRLRGASPSSSQARISAERSSILRFLGDLARSVTALRNRPSPVGV